MSGSFFPPLFISPLKWTLICTSYKTMFRYWFVYPPVKVKCLLQGIPNSEDTTSFSDTSSESDSQSPCPSTAYIWEGKILIKARIYELYESSISTASFNFQSAGTEELNPGRQLKVEVKVLGGKRWLVFENLQVKESTECEKASPGWPETQGRVSENGMDRAGEGCQPSVCQGHLFWRVFGGDVHTYGYVIF